MLDLFGIAHSNGTAMDERFGSVLAKMLPEHAHLLKDFASWVESNDRISINAKLYVVGDILSGRPIQNTYEFAKEQAHLSGRSVEEILRERLQGFYQTRIAFDRAFTGGEKFCYGAMYVGGPGLTEYGPYCVVLTRAFQESLAQIAYLPGDSLEVCFAADATLDEDAVRRFATPRTHRHFMVAISCASEVPSVERGQWQTLVALQEQYFEVIFIGEVLLKAVEHVCVLKAEYDRMWDLAFASFGKKLGAGERAIGNDFVTLQRGVKDGRLKLEIV
ncbi:MAG: hypothetical protein ACLQVL_22070 [Terriglobia bacterium]